MLRLVEIGRFLEYSLPAGDVRESLAFYRALGFTELRTGDIRTHPYAVVTDGRLAIGLHAGLLDEAALSFVVPDLAGHVRALDDPAAEFEFWRVGLDQFHEAGLRDPGGQLVLLMEARTFSAFDSADIPPPWVGQCTELRLACADPAGTAGFWSAAGLIADEPSPEGVARLLAPGLRIGLAAQGAVELRLACDAPADVAARLELAGIPAQRTSAGLRLRAPEGTVIVVTAQGS